MYPIKLQILFCSDLYGRTMVLDTMTLSFAEYCIDKTMTRFIEPNYSIFTECNSAIDHKNTTLIMVSTKESWSRYRSL